MTRWSAVALFGGLLVVEGVFMVLLIPLAIVFVLAAIVLASAGAEEYTWSVLGAGAVGGALEVVLADTGTYAALAPQCQFALWLGGLFLLLLGAAVSVEISLWIRAETD